MGTYNIRFGSQLSFDEQQEADIIKLLEKLNSSHKSGKFFANLIRIACDCPEVLDRREDGYVPGTVLGVLEQCEMHYTRDNFFKALSKEVNDMKVKVDKMYDMVLKTYMLAQMGKHIGLEGKADNQLMAQFITEKQLKDIQDLLGVTLHSSVFASNKKADVEKLGDEVLEYIIESYSGIINELQRISDAQQVIINNPSAVQANTVESTNSGSINQTNTEESIKPTGNSSDSTDKLSMNNFEEGTDEPVDFGNADLNLLSNFFSM